MIVTIFRRRILWDKKYSVFNSPNSWLGIVAQVESLSSETSTLVHRSSRGWVSSYGDFNRSSNTIPQLSIHLSLSPPPIIFSPLFFPPPPTKNIHFTHFSGSLTITINHLFSLISPPLLPLIFFVFPLSFAHAIRSYVLYNMTLCERKLGVIDHSAGHGHVCVPSCQWFPKCTSAHLCTPQTDSTATERILIILLDFVTHFFFFFLPLNLFRGPLETGSRTITKRWGSIVRIYYSGRICLIFLKRNFFWSK